MLAQQPRHSPRRRRTSSCCRCCRLMHQGRPCRSCREWLRTLHRQRGIAGSSSRRQAAQGAAMARSRMVASARCRRLPRSRPAPQAAAGISAARRTGVCRLHTCMHVRCAARARSSVFMCVRSTVRDQDQGLDINPALLHAVPCRMYPRWAQQYCDSLMVPPPDDGAAGRYWARVRWEYLQVNTGYETCACEHASACMGAQQKHRGTDAAATKRRRVLLRAVAVARVRRSRI